MTTSFTCSTGLGDKLLPLLLPGMFWRLFVRLRRERQRERESAVCHRWWRAALKRRKEPSYHLYSQHWWERCACRPFGELCQDRGSGVYLSLHRDWMWNCLLCVSYVRFFIDCLNKFNIGVSWVLSFQWPSFISTRCQSTLKCFVEILHRTAMHHSLWFIMQIYSKISSLLWC